MAENPFFWGTDLERLSGFDFGAGATISPQGELTILSNSPAEVTAPAVLHDVASKKARSKKARRKESIDITSVSPSELRKEQHLVWGRSLKATFHRNDTIEEEAERLREDFRFSVGHPLGGLTYEKSIDLARQRRHHSFTAYVSIGGAYPQLRPSFILSQKAAGLVDELEADAGLDAEAASGIFISKFGEYFVAEASIGFAVRAAITLSHAAGYSTKNFREDLEAAVGAFGFSADVSRKRAHDTASAFSAHALTSQIDTMYEAAYRVEAVGEGQAAFLPIKLPLTLTSPAGLAELIQVVERPDVWFSPGVTGLRVHPVKSLLGLSHKTKVYAGLANRHAQKPPPFPSSPRWYEWTQPITRGYRPQEDYDFTIPPLVAEVARPRVMLLGVGHEGTPPHTGRIWLMERRGDVIMAMSPEKCGGGHYLFGEGTLANVDKGDTIELRLSKRVQDNALFHMPGKGQFIRVLIVGAHERM